MDIFKPATEDQLRDAIHWAVANDKTLSVKGGGSKPGLGYAVDSDAMLDLSDLNQIWSWEPEELVLTAGPGVLLADLLPMLAEKGQMLAFEPPGWAALYDHAGTPTLGGTLATNLAGSRRLTAGAARDHFLGVTAIGGRAEIFKAGGRVVKNVTGYDVCKIMSGSHGTLAAMGLVTVKVLPRPETEKTLIIDAKDHDTAQRLMADLMRGSYDVTSMAFLPGKDTMAQVYARFEGVPPSVDARLAAAQALVEKTASCRVEADRDASTAFWGDCGELVPLQDTIASGDAVLKISVKPSDFASMAGLLDASAASWYADWAGGLFYVVAPAGKGANLVIASRAFVTEYGGHVTILRDNIGLSLPRFEPEPDALRLLSDRIKASFDPQTRLNPGRMTGDAGGR